MQVESESSLLGYQVLQQEGADACLGNASLAQRGVRVAAGSEDGLGERTHRLHDRQICPPALVSHAVFDGRDVGDDELLYTLGMGQCGGHHHFAAE